MICPECKTNEYITSYEDGYWICSNCRSDGNIDDEQDLVYRGYKMSHSKHHLKVNKESKS